MAPEAEQLNMRVAATLSDAFHVFPCDPRTKRPLTAHGFKDATKDSVQIGKWWKKWPDAIPGIPTGSRNGIAVLDLDRKKGKNGFRELSRLGFDFETTSPFTTETMNGGEHRYFRHRAGIKSSSDKIGSGIDVRADGGYVCFYGSVADARTLAMWSDIGLPQFPDIICDNTMGPEDREYSEDREFSFQEIEDALDKIPNDYESRDDWLKIGMAVHSACGPDGFRLWNQWSREHPSYDAANTRSAWRSFGNYSGRQITAETLISEARKRGPVDCTPSDFIDDPETDAAEIAEVRGKEMPRGLRIVSPADCRDRRGSRPYVVKGLLAEGDIAAIVGAPGVGKSLIAPRIGYAVAQGEPVFGLKVRQGSVLYVAAEDAHGMRDRVAALYEEHGDAPDFGIVEGLGNLLEPREVKALRKLVQDTKPRLIVVDTLAMAFSGLEENDAASMGKVVAAARSLTKWGAAVVLVHHDTKAKDGLPRGHSILNGALDMSLHLTREGEFVTGRPTKNRNGTSDLTVTFSISTRCLGHDEDGDEIRAAYADDNAEPAPRQRQLSGPAATAFHELEKLVEINRRVAVAEWRKACVENPEFSTSDNAESRRAAFRRAAETLREKGITKEHDGFIFLNVRKKTVPADFEEREDEY